MAHERVYHPDTNEPFDVPSAKASELVLAGWTRTPWERVSAPADEPEEPAAFTPARGRGRRRRAKVEVEVDVDQPPLFSFEEPGEEDWRS